MIGNVPDSRAFFVFLFLIVRKRDFCLFHFYSIIYAKAMMQQSGIELSAANLWKIINKVMN